MNNKLQRRSVRKSQKKTQCGGFLGFDVQYSKSFAIDNTNYEMSPKVLDSIRKNAKRDGYTSLTFYKNGKQITEDLTKSKSKKSKKSSKSN